jgi:transcriptional regulator with XRE-family HTH domain
MTIGEKIRLLRGSLTQNDLAIKTGIDKAILSKIENGKMRGTLDCHKKLAGVFGLKLSEFYAYLEEEKTQNVEITSGTSHTDIYQNFLEILTNIPLSKKMLPVFLTIAAGEEKTLEETIKKAERFIYMLEGEVEITVETKTYRLNKAPTQEKGDSLYSRSTAKHKIKNIGCAPAKLLCVSTPPIL